jgi:hypothetical protein
MDVKSFMTLAPRFHKTSLDLFQGRGALPIKLSYLFKFPLVDNAHTAYLLDCGTSLDLLKCIN